MTTIRITVDVTVDDDADPDVIAEEVFDYLCATPEGVLDRVDTVDTYDWTRVS